MAKGTCCICREPFGTFDKTYPLKSKTGRVVASGGVHDICSKCEERRNLIISPPSKENEFQYMQYKRAVEFYKDAASNPNIGDEPLREFIQRDILNLSYADRQAIANEASRKAETKERLVNMRDKVVMTTGVAIEGYRIVEYHGIYTGSSVIGSGAIAEAKAGISDMLGSASNAFGDKLSSAAESAYSKMARQCVIAGGNGIIGVNYSTFVIGSNMVGVLASGTSVTIEPSE